MLSSRAPAIREIRPATQPAYRYVRNGESRHRRSPAVSIRRSSRPRGRCSRCRHPGFVGSPTPPRVATRRRRRSSSSSGNDVLRRRALSDALEAYRARLRCRRPTARVAGGRAGVVQSALRVAEFARAREEAAGCRRVAVDDPEVIALYADALWASGLFEEAESALQRRARASRPTWPRALTAWPRRSPPAASSTRRWPRRRRRSRRTPREVEFHHTIGLNLRAACTGTRRRPPPCSLRQPAAEQGLERRRPTGRGRDASSCASFGQRGRSRWSGAGPDLHASTSAW